MAKQTTQFPNFDFQEFFAAAKVPGVNVEAFAAAQKKNMEALVGANQIVAEGFQAVAKRQAEVAQTLVQDAQTRMTELMACASNEDRMAKQAEILKAEFERANDTMKELGDLVQKSQTEAFELLKRRVADGMDEIKDCAA